MALDMPEEHPADRTDAGVNWIYCLLVGLATVLVWGKSARYDFVWDDHLLVLENPSIRSLKNIPKMFVSLAMQSGELAPSYRPVRTAWYAFLYALGGKKEPQAWIFHLSNVLWHAAAAMLLFSVGRLLFERVAAAPAGAARGAAFLAALAFGLHPANSESVCWVKCLDDLLAGFFTLTAAWLLLKWRGDWPRYFGALGCFVVAMYSYETAVPFAAMAFIILYAYHRLALRRSVALGLPFFLLAAAFMSHRHWVMGRTSQSEPLSGSYGQTLVDMFPIVPKYARLAWGVPPFSADYCDLLRTAGHSFFSGPVLAGVVLIVAFAGWIIWMWRASLPLVAVGSLWFGLFLLPVSNVIPTMQYIAERFLYLPLMGFVVAAGALALKSSRKGLMALAGAAILFIWIGVSWNRESVWRDEVTFFVQSSLDEPNCKRLRENAVVSIFELPQVADCFPLAHGTRKLGVSQKMPRDRVSAAVQTLTWAHDLFPDEERFTAALGVGYATLGRISNAIPFLELATRQSTNDPSCWTDLGTAYMLEKNWQGARKAFETALAREATNAAALDRYSKLCFELGDYQRAAQCLQTLTQLQPGNSDFARRLREAKQSGPATGVFEPKR
jgi:protein O-mannosyl-transferase